MVNVRFEVGVVSDGNTERVVGRVTMVVHHGAEW